MIDRLILKGMTTRLGLFYALELRSLYVYRYNFCLNHFLKTALYQIFYDFKYPYQIQIIRSPLYGFIYFNRILMVHINLWQYVSSGFQNRIWHLCLGVSREQQKWITWIEREKEKIRRRLDNM